MNKWIIDIEAMPAVQLEEMERHYDRWWSITTTLESLRLEPTDHDNIKIRAVSPTLIDGLEQQQQEAYEAYTSLAGGLVHKAGPWR